MPREYVFRESFNTNASTPILHAKVTDMKTCAIALIVALLLIASVSAKPEAAAETADTVFKNGNIYTVNERQPHAEAVAVKAGKIIFVGSNRDAKAYEGKGTRVVDLKGNA